MNQKPLNKQSKSEILEILLEKTKEVELLKKELESANKALADRELKIEKAGTLAEAALLLNGVFEAAEEATAQYLENIEKRSEEQDKLYEKKEAEYRKKIKHIRVQTKTECEALKRKTEGECNSLKQETLTNCEALKRQTEAECAELLENADRQVKQKWEELSTRWETLCSARHDMLEVLEILGKESVQNHERIN